MSPRDIPLDAEPCPAPGLPAGPDAPLGRLLAQAKGALWLLAERRLSPLSLTHLQALLLLEVERQAPCSAASLARSFRADPASLSRALGRLESRGLIERARGGDGRDRRVAPLILTPAGSSLAALVPGVHEAVLAEAFDGFSGDELGALRSMLSRVLANAALAAEAGAAPA